MSLALFRSELRTAVREAQDRESETVILDPRMAERASDRRARVLERFAQHEISLEAALAELGDRP